MTIGLSSRWHRLVEVHGRYTIRLLTVGLSPGKRRIRNRIQAAIEAEELIIFGPMLGLSEAMQALETTGIKAVDALNGLVDAIRRSN